MSDARLITRSGGHGEFNVFVEISLGMNVKYEICKTSGVVCVDRILPESVKYPRNYGYVPYTLCEDGDALDVIVLGNTVLQPGCVIRCRAVGVMFMTDESGRDPKILAVPVHDVTPRFDHVLDIGDVNAYDLEELVHFFENYKGLEKPEKVVTIEDGWGDRKAANLEFDQSVALYHKSELEDSKL